MFGTSQKKTTYLGMAYVISVLLDRGVFSVFQVKFLFQNGTYFKSFSSGFDYLSQVKPYVVTHALTCTRTWTAAPTTQYIAVVPVIDAP